MKFQISFDLTDLDKALEIAAKVAPEADILEVGSLLLYQHGTEALKRFHKECPNTLILADAKIVDRGKETVQLLAQAGADFITVMAGTHKDVINSACTTAHELGKKIMLALHDASSPGQSALEAQSFGADALLFHTTYEPEKHALFVDTWDMIKGNTSLPIFICGNINKDNVAFIKSVNPDGIVIGKSVVNDENPLEALMTIKQTPAHKKEDNQ